MRSLTTLEAQFLRRLKGTVESQSSFASEVKSVFLTNAPTSGPGLQVGLQLKNSGTLVDFQILIYGTRPVRYHLESSACPQAESCRGLWNHLLGALNLNLDKSGERSGRLHLFYEVAFPDKELKKLGEK